MLDVSVQRKNKVCLDDYDYKQDIENRLLMAQFTSTDLNVLEEILYSSINIPIRKLSKSLSLEEKEILPVLQVLSKTGLFTFEGDSIVVDKDVRKYFESQILKFDPDFKPGMDFLQNLLKKAPIHILPIWYSIPRTSNNIFDSIVEKYLLTPQIFNRYLMELNAGDALFTGILKEVYQAPDFKVYGKDLIEKFSLTREQFEKALLTLEFNLVCCLGYTKIDDEWKEVVTPFYEWKEYLTFLRNTEATSIVNTSTIERFRPLDFSFIEDLHAILSMAKKQPLALNPDKTPQESLLPTIAAQLTGFKENAPAILPYLNKLISKLRLLKLAEVVDGRLYVLDSANDWLSMKPEARGMFLYRHPLNQIDSNTVPIELCTERAIREAEKSVIRVLNSGWVYFDDFMQGVIAPLSAESSILLKHLGKTWKYVLPKYTEDELSLIKIIVLDWLFQIGITSVGIHEGKDCFCVTPFGQSIFGR